MWVEKNVDLLGKKGLDIDKNRPPRGKYYWDREWDKWWDTVVPDSRGLRGAMEGAKLKVSYIDAKAEQRRQEARVVLYPTHPSTTPILRPVTQVSHSLS